MRPATSRRRSAAVQDAAGRKMWVAAHSFSAGVRAPRACSVRRTGRTTCRSATARLRMRATGPRGSLGPADRDRRTVRGAVDWAAFHAEAVEAGHRSRPGLAPDAVRDRARGRGTVWPKSSRASSSSVSVPSSSADRATLDGVERVCEKPVAPLAAGGAAGAHGPDQPAAGARLVRQVDAGTQLHVVEVAAARRSAVETTMLAWQKVIVSSGDGARPTGRLAWQRSATSCAAGGGGRRAAPGVERVWSDGPAGLGAWPRRASGTRRGP